jgi:hypothetical protein
MRGDLSVAAERGRQACVPQVLSPGLHFLPSQIAVAAEDPVPVLSKAFVARIDVYGRNLTPITSRESIHAETRSRRLQ